MTLAKKDTCVTIAQSRPYEQQIDAASEMHVVFYDTDTQKGWLFDGATALLHLARGWLSSEYASSSAEQAISEFTSSSVYDGRRSSRFTLNLDDNRKIKLYSRKSRGTEENTSESLWCWEDLVEQKWISLEKMCDYIEGSQTTSQPQVQMKAHHNKVLEGFEYCDILSNKAKIMSKAVVMDPNTATWMDMVQDNCVIPIFGSGFGDLIVPAEARCTTGKSFSKCGQQSLVPDGFNYLTAPLDVIRKIAENYDEREDGSVALSDSVYWTKPNTCLGKCPCGSKKTIRCSPSVAQLTNDHKLSVTHLVSSFQSLGKGGKSCSSTDIFKCHPNGAVIFGNDTKTAAKKACKRKQNFGDDSERIVRPRYSDSGIDVGSSSSFGTSSSPRDTQSTGDSGLAEDRSE